MSGAKDYRTDLDMWIDMWDEAQKDGIHPEAEKPKPATYSSGFNRAQDDYYDYLDCAEELLQEGKSQNPVYPDSVGKDQDNPQPAWVSEAVIKEVLKLKEKLFALENKMARMGNGKGWQEKVVHDNGKKLMSEIQSIRKRIDRVSDSLGVKDEPTPWRTQSETRQ